MQLVIPNSPPSYDLSYRLAIIGDVPSNDDVSSGQPFSGPTGNILNKLLQVSEIQRAACFVGNISQVVTPVTLFSTSKSGEEEKEKKFNAFEYREFLGNNPHITRYAAELKEELNAYQPNCILLHGQAPLSLAGIDHSLHDYRGSIFQCRDQESPFYKFKCMATHHPTRIIKVWDWLPLVQFDIGKARREADFPDLRLPTRTFAVDLNADQIISRLDSISSGTWVSVDIEGGIPNPEADKPEYRFPQGVTCISFSTDPLSGFIVNWLDHGEANKLRLARAMARVLGDPTIPKVLQNSLYDNFVLSWLYKMPIRNVVHDTMLSGWEKYPELPKSLGVQTSIWTDEPFYKYERKIQDSRTHHIYCCKDSAVTLEIAQRHIDSFTETERSHFRFNMSLLPAFLYMELKGIGYNLPLAAEKLAEVTLQMSHLQTFIDRLAGKSLNVNSPKQMVEVLYRTLGLQPQYQKENGRKTDKLTADVDALLALLKSAEHPIILHILKWRALEGRRKQLEITPDTDGRIRCSYNVVGTDTGRVSCSSSPTGNGTNLQTITKKLRCIYTADPGYHFFQCDLSGADGWTVAARCLDLGDDTMYEDYLYGLKPARIIAAMYESQKLGKSISSMDRATLKAYIKAIEIPDWLYFACKRVQHGSNYLLGINTMSEIILKDSWKIEESPIYLSPKDCERLQRLYLARYWGVGRWQKSVDDTIRTTRKLSCCSGHTRHFFGRPTDNNTIREACSHEPQANTTFVTNLALQRLWNDPDNRLPSGKFIIEPLHQVHDALNGQFPIDQTDWAVAKIRSYFNNPVTIGRTTLTIPFEGQYGPTWGELPHEI